MVLIKLMPFNPRAKKAFEISDNCVGCGFCSKQCPANAISGQKKQKHNIDYTKCEQCGSCWNACPRGAITNPQGLFREKKGIRLLATINSHRCAGCQNCFLNCPNNAIIISKNGGFESKCKIITSKCKGCASCDGVCFTEALSLISIQDTKKK